LSDPQTTLGRYQLLDRISIGGMAEVFRAKAVGEVGFEKMVAVKRILPHMVDDAEFVDMFIDEARTVAQLNHANICQIFEFGHEKGTYFIALELVEGKDLKRIMEYHRLRGRPIPLGVALYIVRRTCEALDYAHNCHNSQGEPMNIVHRDVSPQNILISYAGEVKLIDFGIAKAVGRQTKTSSGNIKGKFGYMSPEQVTGKPIDHRSDIFACGTLLFELVTNTRLFRGETDLATMQMVRRAAVEPPSRIQPDLPPDLDAVVMRALAREPDNRQESAGQLLDELEAIAVESGNTCSTQQLSRFMNDVFAQDREQARARARDAEAQAGQAPDGPEPRPEASPEFIPGTEPRPPHGTVTGRGTVTTTSTDTEYVYVSSVKPWILVGILVALLVTGGVLVALLWPSQTRVVKVPIPGEQHAPRIAPLPAAPDSRPPTAAPAVPAPVPDRVVARRAQARRRRPRRHTRPTPMPPPSPAPPPAAPAARSGTLIVAAKPWARVWVDGADTGRNTPIPASAPLRLSPGRHTVTLLVNERPFTFAVTIQAGRTTKLIKHLPVKR
jgi:serine/threonine protein kinase